jgi:hypothetical protein
MGRPVSTMPISEKRRDLRCIRPARDSRPTCHDSPMVVYCTGRSVRYLRCLCCGRTAKEPR